MTMADIRTERHGAIAAIQFDRPQKRNALTAEMYEQLGEALRAAEEDAGVRVLLFHGHREVFCAGNDLADFLRRPPLGEDTPAFRFIRRVSAMAKPMVAAVNGPAIGIGTTLLLHCDLVYAGDDARFQLPFARLGLVPEFASSYLLPLVAGWQRAAELLLLGEPFDAAQAYAAGIVTRVVPAADALTTARQAAERLAVLPPAALATTKALMKRTHQAAIAAQLEAEGEHFRRMLTEPAAREAFAAFMEKRAPDFTGAGM
jgi:enoyl-CoA hydratase/carnithine racemase